jgi:hypothetical protein
MQEMEIGDEVVSVSGRDATPLPMRVEEKVLQRTQTITMAILEWIAKASGKPWFPSQHAATMGTDRDSLDEPLTQLRMDGLIQIETWIRGLGQGYVLTPDGEQALVKNRKVLTNDTPPEQHTSDPALSVPDPATSPVELQSPSPLPIEPRHPYVAISLLVVNALWLGSDSSHPRLTKTLGLFGVGQRGSSSLARFGPWR